MYGLFVTIVITTLVIEIHPECHPPLYITHENNYVTEPDVVLIYCPWSLCHHNGDHYKRTHALCILIDCWLGVRY